MRKNLGQGAAWALAIAATLAVSCSESHVDPAPSSDAGIEHIPGDAGAAHYTSERVLRYDLEIDAAAWQAMLADPLCTGKPPCGGEYAEATLHFEGRTFPGVGVRFKGNSSLSSVAKLSPSDPGYGRYSLKLKLDKFASDQTLDGIETLNLNNELLDPTLIREVLAYEVFRGAGLAAGRTAWAEVYLNGELYGLYVSVEEVEAPFLKAHFGSAKGNLYKPDYGDLVYRGPNIADYAMTVSGGPGDPPTQVTGEQAYAKQNHESEADYEDILRLMDVLNHTPESDLEQELGKVFDIDAFVAFLAANTLLTALDFYGGGLPQNYLLYHDPSTDRMTYLPWDLNNAFGTFDCFMLTEEQVVWLPIDGTYCLGTPNAVNGGNPVTATDRPLLGRLLASASIRAKVHARLSQLLVGAFEPIALQSRVDTYATLIRPSLQKDPRRFYTMEQFEAGLTETVDGAPGLKTFISARASAVQAWLSGACEEAGSTCPAPEASVDAPACGSCEKYHDLAGKCVPACDQGCACPPGPDGGLLVCDTQLGICHP